MLTVSDEKLQTDVEKDSTVMKILDKSKVMRVKLRVL